MKTRVLPLVAFVSMAAAGIAQAEGPIDGKVYGKINVTLQSADEGTDSRVTEVVSNASRFGFKGETKLDEQKDISVIYQIEYEVNIDDGDNKGKTITQRNSFAGVKGSFGTVLAGIHDTPMKMAQGKVDQFNDLEGDLKHLFGAAENRGKNTVMYRSPEMSGVSADFAIVAAEDDNTDDGISMAVKFKQDALYAALAYEQDVDAEGTDSFRLVGEYTIDAITVGAMWQKTETTTDDEDGFLLSGAYKMGDIKLKAQYGQSDIEAKGRDQISLGADYKLGKKTKVFGFYTMQDEDAANKDKDWLGVGLEHKF